MKKVKIPIYLNYSLLFISIILGYVTFSNMLVDKSNKLYQAYERGEISMLQLRQGQTILESQIPLYKAMNDSWSTQTEKVLALNDARSFFHSSRYHPSLPIFLT